jgi:hypothetical protein
VDGEKKGCGTNGKVLRVGLLESLSYVLSFK